MKLIEFLNDSQTTLPRSYLLERDQIVVDQLSLNVDVETEGDTWVHLGVFHNNDLVGELTVDDGEILWIHVEPEFRRKKLGTKMVQFLRSKGYPVVHSDSLTKHGQAFVGGLSQKGELDEVESLSSFGDDPDQADMYKQYSQRFDPKQDEHIGNITNASLYMRGNMPQRGTREIFILEDSSDEPAGYARVVFGKTDGHFFASVIMIWINEEHRGQGLARDFYLFLLEDLGLMLISDKQQTSEAQSIWMWLVEQYQTVLLNKYNIIGEVNSVDDFFSVYDVPGEEYDLRLGVIPKKRITPLEEVVRLGSMDWQYDDAKAGMLRQYERKEDKLEKFGTLDGFELWFEVNIEPETDNYRLYLIKPNEDQPSGYAVIRPMGKMTIKIGMIWLSREIRKQGLGFSIYEFFLNQGYRIISDFSQTPESRSIWKRLVQKYEASIVGNDGKKITDINTLNDFLAAFEINHVSDLIMVVPKKRSKPLTESQSDLSQTAVVDKNGDPMMVYHIGVGQHKTRFRPLSHFGTDEAAHQRMQNVQAGIRRAMRDLKEPKDSAEYKSARDYLKKKNYGKEFRQFAVYLDIRNPLEIRDSPNTMHNSLVLLGELMKKGLLYKEHYYRVAGFSSEKERMGLLKKTMKQHGYDGFVYENRQEDRGSLSWIILDPSQVHVVERKTIEGLNEYIRKGEPTEGLLYRWVEPKKAFSNLDTNSLYPGKWTHDIPTVGTVAGVSFGYDPKRWKPEERAVGFVLDRSKLNPKKIVDIPGHEVYSHSVGAKSVAPEQLSRSKDDILSPDVEPDEAFYVGIIRPLSNALEHIIIKGDLPPKLLRLIYVYSERHGIPVYNEDGTPHQGQHDHFDNPALKESFNYDYSRMDGFWIDEFGNIHEVDHDRDYHHIDVLADQLDVSEFTNDNGEIDDYAFDAVADMALNIGWIRVSTFALQTVSWGPKDIVVETHNPTPEALAVLIRWLAGFRGNPIFSLYVTSYHKTAEGIDRADLIDLLEKQFPRRMRRALRMMNESMIINENYDGVVRSLHNNLPDWALVPFGQPGEFHGYIYDTYVEGEGEPGRFFNIYSWTSEEPGKGNTERALKLLKQVYGPVAAHGIGSDPSDKSWTYWVRMYEKGLVDGITDDDGMEIKPETVNEDQGEFDWAKPITFYRGVVDPTHAEKPFAGTRRGVPTFTDVWHIADVYAQSPNDLTRDRGKKDRVYAYRLNIKNPLLLNEGREDVTEANFVFKKLGAQTVEEAWEMFLPLYKRMDSWRTDGGVTFKEEVSFPYQIEGFAGFPDKTYNSMKEIFIDNWEQDFPGFYCTSYELADDDMFQAMVRRTEYDGIVMYGHTTLFAYDDDIFTGTSFDGVTAMEWRALYPEQIEYLGPAGNPTEKKAVESYHVNEAFDTNPYPVRYEGMRQKSMIVKLGMEKTVNMDLYSFRTENNTYLIQFFDTGKKDTRTVSFGTKDGLLSPTREGIPLRVFSTLVDLIKRYARDNGINTIVFHADKTSGLVSVYKRMLDYFSSRLGFTYTFSKGIGNHSKFVLKLNESNIVEARKPWLRITPTMIDQAKGNKCQVIVEMSASQFLYMTTFPSGSEYHPTMDDIVQHAQPLRSYNRWAKMGHDRDFANRANKGRERGSDEYEHGTILMPMLQIQLDNDGTVGKITGHEGRHRAAAALNHGNGRIQVALCIRPGRDMFPDVMFGAEYHITAEHLPKYVEGQINGQMYPTRDWKVIQNDLQAGVRRRD